MLLLSNVCYDDVYTVFPSCLIKYCLNILSYYVISYVSSGLNKLLEPSLVNKVFFVRRYKKLLDRWMRKLNNYDFISVICKFIKIK